ncbi:MAG: AGE family epimerase/isomerase [Bacteroidales bacterium]
MKRHKFILYLTFTIILSGCGSSKQGDQSESQIAQDLEESLFTHIVDAWYPRCLDSLYGGYLPDFEYDWTLSDGLQEKSLVQQSRHLWALSYLYQQYPANSKFLEYAKWGYDFMKENFPDDHYGGLYNSCERSGDPALNSLFFKRSYAQAFAIHGLAKYFEVSGDSTALAMAINTFLWLDEKARDPVHGGYFESLDRDGRPQEAGPDAASKPGYLPHTGLKEFNSSIHILEALTELYRVWPDSLAEIRLEEMYTLFKEKLIHPDGYLVLYFNPDWTSVPKSTMDSLSQGNSWYTQHISFGHDVETAYLLLEAAQALGKGEDEQAYKLAKKLVDHSLDHGWDDEKGGFYYIGYKQEDYVLIHDPHKAWWTQAEGLNALHLMHSLNPNDKRDYYGKFLQLWKYIDTYLIDKENGGWYNYGLDNYPENKTLKKSHNWKASYHNVRGVGEVVQRNRE